MGDPIDDRLEDELEAEEPPRRASVARAAAPSGTAAPQRPGIGGAFRSAFRPLDLRGDLRALPQILRHWSFLLPTILAGLSVALIPLVGVNALTQTFYQYFSFSAPLGTSFIAGFFAPRASYLAGGLAALASVGFQALAFSGPGNFGGMLDVFADPVTGQLLGKDTAGALILNQALFVGVPSAVFFASAAAWYRRFLNRANPNRAARPSGPTGGRRPDGKVPKRNTQRPMLARRR